MFSLGPISNKRQYLSQYIFPQWNSRLVEVAEVHTVDELLIVFNNFLTLANGGNCNWNSLLQGKHGLL